MSAVASKYDFFKNQKMAGVTLKVDGNSSANCLKTQNQPETPPHIKKYRKSYKQQEGTTILHYGIADDQIAKDKTYGHATKQSDHANQCLVNKQHEGINELITEIQENKYASRHKEPLGRRQERNYVFPEQVNQQNFQFGAKTQQNEFTGKEVMFPQSDPRETQDALDVYIKSHGDQGVGSQKQRGYNWGNLNKHEHRFGKTEQSVPNEVQYCLNQESIPDQFPKTTIVLKKQEDCRNFKEDPLGQPKNLAQVNKYVNQETVYGATQKGKDQWDVSKCIQGEATWKEAQPDSDLGKTNKFGFRNTTKEGDENRVFGIPTIRNDVVKKKLKSVADPNNYGDEPQAISLLFPQVYQNMGVEQQDFLIPRPKEEIRSIFESIGVKYKTGKFEGIYQRAMELQNSQDGKVCVRAFQAADQQMRDIE